MGVADEAGDAADYFTRLGPLILQSGVVGAGSTSVWFNASDLPRQTGAAPARLAARALGCAVSCDPGDEYPKLDPLSPVFLEVSADGERLFVPDAGSLAFTDATPFDL